MGAMPVPPARVVSALPLPGEDTVAPREAGDAVAGRACAGDAERLRARFIGKGGTTAPRPPDAPKLGELAPPRPLARPVGVLRPEPAGLAPRLLRPVGVERPDAASSAARRSRCAAR